MLRLVPVTVCCLGIVTASFSFSRSITRHTSASDVKPLTVNSDLDTPLVNKIQTYCQDVQNTLSLDVTSLTTQNLFTQLPCSKVFVIDLFAHCQSPILPMVLTAINGFNSKEGQAYGFKYAPAILFTLIEQYKPQDQPSSSSMVNNDFSTIKDWFCHMLSYYYKQANRELPNFLHSLHTQATSDDWYTATNNPNQKRILKQLLKSKCPDVDMLKSQLVKDYILSNRLSSNVTLQLAAYGVYPASNAEHPYYSAMHKLLNLSRLESESAKTSIAALTSDVKLAPLFESSHDGVLTVADYVLLQGPEFIKALHGHTLKEPFYNDVTLGLDTMVKVNDNQMTLADMLVSIVFSSDNLVQGSGIQSRLAPHSKFLLGANFAKHHFESIDSNIFKNLKHALAKCVGLYAVASADRLHSSDDKKKLICRCLFQPGFRNFDSTYVMHGAFLLQDQCFSDFEPQLQNISIPSSDLKIWINYGMCLGTELNDSSLQARGLTIYKNYTTYYISPSCPVSKNMIESETKEMVNSLILKLDSHSKNILKTFAFPPASPRLQARFEQAHLLPTPNRFHTLGNVELAKYYSSPFTEKPPTSSYWRIATIVIVVLLLVAILGGVAFFVYRKRMAAAAADEERPPRPRPVRPAGPSDEAKPASGAGRLGGRAPPRRGRRAPIPTAMEAPAEDAPADSAEDQSAESPEDDSAKH